MVGEICTNQYLPLTLSQLKSENRSRKSKTKHPISERASLKLYPYSKTWIYPQNNN